jgi:futalosine hydrolase
MNKILIVAATEDEIKDIIQAGLPCDVLITGVGMIATTFALTRKLQEQTYDLIINIGIAGSFDRNIPLGTVVQVVKDTFSELGAEDNGKFIDIFDMGFVGANDTPFHNKWLVGCSHTPLKSVSGITVNKVHGNISSIEEVVKDYNPDVESMEGAGCMYVALSMGMKVLQVRSISNYVEPRNRSNWQIPLAIKNLNNFVIKNWDTLVSIWE